MRTRRRQPSQAAGERPAPGVHPWAPPNAPLKLRATPERGRQTAGRWISALAIGLALAVPGALPGVRGQQTNKAAAVPAARGSVAGSSVAGVTEPTNIMKAAFLNNMETLDDKHRLAAGDRLSFRVLEDEEDSKPLFVTDSGEVELPYIGRFPAKDKTCKELALAIKVELEKEYYYQATVILAVDVMSKSRGRVYLQGDGIRTTGPLELPSDEVVTVSKAIARVGGFTEFANRKDIRIIRKPEHPGGGDRTYTVNGAEVLDQGKIDRDLVLEPDDIIIVRERRLRLR